MDFTARASNPSNKEAAELVYKELTQKDLELIDSYLLDNHLTESNAADIASYIQKDMKSGTSKSSLLKAASEKKDPVLEAWKAATKSTAAGLYAIGLGTWIMYLDKHVMAGDHKHNIPKITDHRLLMAHLALDLLIIAGIVMAKRAYKLAVEHNKQIDVEESAKANVPRPYPENIRRLPRREEDLSYGKPNPPPNKRMSPTELKKRIELKNIKNTPKKPDNY